MGFKNAIVFVHAGYRYNLLQLSSWMAAAAMESGFPVILVTDEKNREFACGNIQFVSFEDLSQAASVKIGKLKGCFVNDGPNADKFEFFCFQRFILIEQLMKEHCLDRILHLDSDVLLYSNPLPFLQGSDERACLIANASTYFSTWTPSSVNIFNDFVLNDYFRGVWHDRYCDMGAIEEVVKRNPSVFRVNRDYFVPYGSCQRRDLSFREFILRHFGERPEFREALVNGPERLPAVTDGDMNTIIEWRDGKPLYFGAELGFVHLQGDTKRYAQYFSRYAELSWNE